MSKIQVILKNKFYCRLSFEIRANPQEAEDLLEFEYTKSAQFGAQSPVSRILGNPTYIAFVSRAEGRTSI